MVRLREIPRTASFAWSPGAASPLIATGTRAGAVDADFSNETCLELWDLGLNNDELRAVAKVETKAIGTRPDQRFYFLWRVGGWPQSSQYLCTFCRIIHCVHIIAA